jgi:hypothetical protein
LQTRKSAAAAAADCAGYSSDGSMTDFLAGLEPGSEHDWLPAALDKPSNAET